MSNAYFFRSLIDSTEEVTSDGGSASNADAKTLNVGIIVASVLGGVLFTLIVTGLVIFFFWRTRRNKKKKLLEVSSSSIPSTEPVIVSNLYNFALSQRDSSVSSAQTMTYHLYEELL